MRPYASDVSGHHQKRHCYAVILERITLKPISSISCAVTHQSHLAITQDTSRRKPSCLAEMRYDTSDLTHRNSSSSISHAMQHIYMFPRRISLEYNTSFYESVCVFCYLVTGIVKRFYELCLLLHRWKEPSIRILFTFRWTYMPNVLEKLIGITFVLLQSHVLVFVYTNSYVKKNIFYNTFVYHNKIIFFHNCWKLKCNSMVSKLPTLVAQVFLSTTRPPHATQSLKLYVIWLETKIGLSQLDRRLFALLARTLNVSGMYQTFLSGLPVALEWYCHSDSLGIWNRSTWQLYKYSWDNPQNSYGSVRDGLGFILSRRNVISRGIMTIQRKQHDKWTER